MDDLNLSDAIEGLLSDPKIKELVKSLSGENPGDTPSPSPEGAAFPDIGKIMKLKDMYESAANTSDPRVTLLSALRPYLSEVRVKNLEVCIKFLKFYKVASVLKDTGILKELL